MISLVRGLRRHYDNYCGNSTSVYPRSASLSLPSGSISNSAFAAAAAALFMSKWHLNGPVSSNDFTPPIASLTSPYDASFFLLRINIEKQQTRAQKPKENRFLLFLHGPRLAPFPCRGFCCDAGERKKTISVFFGAFALKHPPQRGWDVLHQMISSPTHTANAQWTRRREVNLVFHSRGG